MTPITSPDQFLDICNGCEAALAVPGDPAGYCEDCHAEAVPPMTADLIRARTPIDSERTIEFLIDPTRATTTRTGTLYGTIVEHDGGTVVVGSHPHLYEFTYAQIVGIR